MDDKTFQFLCFPAVRRFGLILLANLLTIFFLHCISEPQAGRALTNDKHVNGIRFKNRQRKNLSKV